MRLVLRLAVGVACAVALAGCPRGANDPPPSDAPPCRTVADCNPGVSCGLLHACVAAHGSEQGNCEGDPPSLEVPCP